MFILWHHISDIFYEDKECCLQILPKLSNEHIKFTRYSKVNMSLAVHVLNYVSKVLLAYDPPEAAETTRFCLLTTDCFFDIMDIPNNQSHEFEQKPMLATI